MARYLRSLQREITHLSRERTPLWNTVYIGGGTPSLLPSNLLESLLSNILNIKGLSQHAEVSIEANPESLDNDCLAVIRDGGINRLSIGIQSFSDRLLRALGRPHTAGDARAACDRARSAGVDNLSIDLIFGIPGQSLRDWERDLQEVAALAPDHVSLYELTLEEGTAFDSRARRQKLSLPPEDETLAMYRTACSLLAASGWRHYEISNWALPGRECRHNLDCWRLGEYDGAGAGAHGFRRSPPALRYGNVATVEEYIALVDEGKPPRSFEEKLDGRTLAGEGLMLGLRTMEGVDVAAFEGEFTSHPRELFPGAFELGDTKGWILEKEGRIRFTSEGIDFSNEFFQLLF